jgi:hypothetical protein
VIARPVGLTLRSPKLRGAWSAQWGKRETQSRAALKGDKVSLNLLKKWLDECKEKGMPELSRLQMFALVDFVNWLDTRSPTLRAPVQSEQKCPSCEGRGWNFIHGTIDKKVCSRCNGRGISNRSDGG